MWIAEFARYGSRPSDAPASILIPAYQEERTIGEVLRRVARDRHRAGRLRQGDPGLRRRLDRPHGRRDRARAWPSRTIAIRLVRHEHNRGKGAAIRTALADARGDYVLIQDADLEYEVSDYPALLAAVNAGADVVYGSRFLDRHAPDGMRAANYVANRILTAVRQPALRAVASPTRRPASRCSAPTCSRSLELECEGFEFCPEVTAKLGGAAMPIVEVPIAYQRARHRRGQEGALDRRRRGAVGARRQAPAVQRRSGASRPPASATRPSAVDRAPRRCAADVGRACSPRSVRLRRCAAGRVRRSRCRAPARWLRRKPALPAVDAGRLLAPGSWSRRGSRWSPWPAARRRAPGPSRTPARGFRGLLAPARPARTRPRATCWAAVVAGALGHAGRPRSRRCACLRLAFKEPQLVGRARWRRCSSRPSVAGVRRARLGRGRLRNPRGSACASPGRRRLRPSRSRPRPRWPSSGRAAGGGRSALAGSCLSRPRWCPWRHLVAAALIALGADAATAVARQGRPAAARAAPPAGRRWRLAAAAAAAHAGDAVRIGADPATQDAWRSARRRRSRALIDAAAPRHTTSTATATARCSARTTARRSTARSIRGARDLPDNGVDENCDGRDFSLARAAQRPAGRACRCRRRSDATGTSCSSPSTPSATTTRRSAATASGPGARHHAAASPSSPPRGVVHVRQRAVGRHHGVGARRS